MTGSSRFPTGVLVVIAVVIGVVWLVARQPDAGSVDRDRKAPVPPVAGPIEEMTGPTVTLTSSVGSTGSPGGTVATGSLFVDLDDETLTATSLVDGDLVWRYDRDDHSIDDWTVSADALWVIFDDRLLVRVDVDSARVSDSTVVDELDEGDDPPTLSGDGVGGVVVQAASDAVWWVGRDLDPIALDLPRDCDAPSDVSSDGDRIFLLAPCPDGQRVAAFSTDGGSEWVGDPTGATELEVDREYVVVHTVDGSALLDPESGDVTGTIPATAAGPYLSAADGLFVAWEPDAPPSRASLAVWSADGRRLVWRLAGAGSASRVSAPLVSDRHLYYARTTYDDEPTFDLVVVDVTSGESWSTELSDPGPTSCDGEATEFRPGIFAGIPGGIVVSWQDETVCAAPVLEVYVDAG